MPFGNAQLISEVIAAYSPEYEFVALIMGIAGSAWPQLWFDVFPREHTAPMN